MARPQAGIARRYSNRALQRVAGLTFPPNIRNAFPGRVAEPETVNFDETPAKLLDRLYRQHTRRSYKKVTNGRQLFSNLDPATAYEKCPHLRALLDAMLALAHNGGQSMGLSELKERDHR